jgi:type I restriction enzyme M protein
LVPEAHNGLYASNEFPTFTVRNGVDNPSETLDYLVALFTSQPYLSVVDRESTGSTKTSRNRYKSDRFLATTVPFPKNGTRLKEIVRIARLAAELRSNQSLLLERVKQAHDSMLMLLPGPNR